MYTHPIKTRKPRKLSLFCDICQSRVTFEINVNELIYFKEDGFSIYRYYHINPNIPDEENCNKSIKQHCLVVYIDYFLNIKGKVAYLSNDIKEETVRIFLDRYYAKKFIDGYKGTGKICSCCGKRISMYYICQKCDEILCIDHKSIESHDCFPSFKFND